MKILYLFLCLGLLFSCFSRSVAADSAKPNIVLIISDDQAWTDYGFMGHPEIKTPHLDKLASQSLLFTRGYVTTSLCCPSLAALLTGKYAHQTRVTGNEPPKSADAAVFAAQTEELNSFVAQHPCIPSELGKLGYVSFQSGKWWAGNFKTGGFTHGMSHGDRSHGGRHGDDGLKIGRSTMQPVFDFIDSAKDQPFFVWYAPMLPHDPHTPPARLLAKYKDKTPSPHLAKYWAMCEWFDETCGQLLGFLDDRKLAENTIVIYVTDNGWIQLPDSAGFRLDSKRSQYDAGLRTPIMIRWPKKITPAKIETPVSSIDIAPTLYHALDHKVEGLPGINLLDAKAVKDRPAIFGACFLHNAVDIHRPEKNLCWRWCISGPWKLIVPRPDNITKSPRENIPRDAIELYDLIADPQETKNLAAEKTNEVERLRKEMDSWWKAE